VLHHDDNVMTMETGTGNGYVSSLERAMYLALEGTQANVKVALSAYPHISRISIHHATTSDLGLKLTVPVCIQTSCNAGGLHFGREA